MCSGRGVEGDSIKRGGKSQAHPLSLLPPFPLSSFSQVRFVSSLPPFALLTQLTKSFPQILLYVRRFGRSDPVHLRLLVFLVFLFNLFVPVTEIFSVTVTTMSHPVY